MGNNNRHADLASTGGAKLTSREEAFARLIALEGLGQSAAYRQTHNVSPDSKPETTWVNASHLATKVQPRIAELRGAVQAQSVASRERIVEELAKVGYAERATGPVRDADKTAALKEIGRITGLYTEQPKDQRPITLTKVTVVLDRGDAGKTEEVRVLKPRVVEGEAHVLDENGTDAEDKQ